MIGGIGDGNRFVLHVDRLFIDDSKNTKSRMSREGDGVVVCDTLGPISNSPMGLYGHSATKTKDGIFIFGGVCVCVSVCVVFVHEEDHPNTSI